MRACEGRLGREPKGTGTARLAVGKRQPPLQPRPARRRHAQPPPWIGTAVRGVWPRSFPCIPGTGSIWFQHCWIHARLATRTFTRSPTACECPAPVKKQASWTTQRPLGTREKWRPDEAQRRLQRREGQAHQRPPHPPLNLSWSHGRKTSLNSRLRFPGCFGLVWFGFGFLLGRLHCWPRD